MKISRKQYAVYWSPLGIDGTGRPTFNDPIQMRIRWELKNEVFINAQGQEERSLSVVYPSASVSLNGYMWLGLLADLPLDDSPFGVAGSQQIKSIYDCPNVKNTSSLLKAWLV